MGTSYRSEGALWLRTSRFGDDKDRVLERSSGDHTYFASDIAYHQEKRERGFDRLIDVWGADHHGYVQRMKAAYGALGGDPDKLELLIMQFVHLVERGGRASMSKRSGEFVTLDELVSEIGVDAARWFLLARSHDTTIELDLDVAREEKPENNPVHYVRYAHARTSKMLRDAGELPALAGDAPAFALHAVRARADPQAADLPGRADRGGRPPRAAPGRHLRAGARPHAVGVLPRLPGAQGGAAPSCARSGCTLCLATRRTLARSLRLLGVSAPESM